MVSRNYSIEFRGHDALINLLQNHMRVKMRRLQYDVLMGTVDVARQKIQQTFFTGGYYKPPYDTGALHQSVRCWGVRDGLYKMHRSIIAGGVQREGKFVNYAEIVHEGRGRHRGPRRFMKDGIERNMTLYRNDVIKRTINEMRKGIID